jgi:hypothetical protein
LESGGANFLTLAGVGYDHQWVTCISHLSDGSKGEEIAFDYWTGYNASVSPKILRDKYEYPKKPDGTALILQEDCCVSRDLPDGYDRLSDVRLVPSNVAVPDPYGGGFPRGM